MYTEYFGLNKGPFVLSPDPEFLFLSRGHDLALTYLEYGLVQKVGFVALTGEIGAGKTTLLKYLFEKVKQSLDIAIIFNTNLDARSLLEALVKEFELSPTSQSKTNLIEALYKHFIDHYSKRSRCVIIVDEAQNLPLDAFEELRMLSNLEVGSDFLVQIILVGQPQLRERLSHPSLAQLTQRISVHYHLSALSTEEVAAYIDYRLGLSGYQRSEPLFLEKAVARVAEASKGIPRIINLICDACLTYAFADEIPRITRVIVDKVITDSELMLSSLGSSGNGNKQAADEARPQCEQGSITGASEQLSSLVSRINGRMELLEMRMKTVESTERDAAVKVLQEMLTEEKKRTLQYAQSYAVMARRIKELTSELEILKQQQHKEIKGQVRKENRKTWRLFGERS